MSDLKEISKKLKQNIEEAESMFNAFEEVSEILDKHLGPRPLFHEGGRIIKAQTGERILSRKENEVYKSGGNKEEYEAIEKSAAEWLKNRKK